MVLGSVGIDSKETAVGKAKRPRTGIESWLDSRAARVGHTSRPVTLDKSLPLAGLPSLCVHSTHPSGLQALCWKGLLEVAEGRGEVSRGLSMCVRVLYVQRRFL